MLALLSLSGSILSDARVAAQFDPWRQFKLGLVEGTWEVSQVRIDDIRFEVGRTIFGEQLLASLNAKNLAEETRSISASMGLFTDDKSLLCANSTSSGFKARDVGTLRINFGRCGSTNVRAGRVKFFQVSAFSQKSQ